MIGPLGMQEMLIIMGVALIVFGPRKLPQIGKTLGRSLAEFRRTSSELRNTLEREVEMEEFRSAREEISGAGDDLRAGLDPDGGAPRRTRPSAPAGAGAPSSARPANPAGPAPADDAEPPAGGAAPDSGSSGAGESPGAAGDDRQKDGPEEDGPEEDRPQEGGQRAGTPEGNDAGAPRGPGEPDGEADAGEGTPSR